MYVNIGINLDVSYLIKKYYRIVCFEGSVGYAEVNSTFMEELELPVPSLLPTCPKSTHFGPTPSLPQTSAALSLLNLLHIFWKFDLPVLLCEPYCLTDLG
jgi:hypothetical protein